MKVALHKRLLTTASALTLAACTFSQAQAGGLDTMKPAMAEPLPGITAVMSMWAAGYHLDSGDNDFDGDNYFTFGGDARIANENYIIELLAAQIQDTSSASGTSEASQHFALAGHWLHRRPDQTIGLFAGMSGTGAQDSSKSWAHLFGGVEAALFRGDKTYFGQTGFISSIHGEETDTWNGGFIRGGARFFHTNQSKVEVDLLIGFGTFDHSSDDGYTAAWGLEYERQLGIGSPYSFFTAYRGHYVEDSGGCEESCDESATDHGFIFGFRIHTTGSTAPSLRERDRTGATTFNAPDTHRAIAWPEDL